MKKNTLPKLADLLKYKNPHVLARYRKDYPKNQLSGNQALKEVLKYLWLCQKYQSDKKRSPRNKDLDFECVVHYEMDEIDDMWHTFLLFTKDYADLCQKYFGKFMHHIPIVSKKRPSKAKYEKELSLYLSYIYDNLGGSTLKIWFKDYI